MRPAGPRAAAVAALLHQEQGGYANLVLDAELARSGLTGRDRAFAGAVFYTTVEKQAALDYILGRFLPKGVEKLDPPVRAILRSGLAQARFMQVPPSAAVNEAVKLTRAYGKASAAGLVNAVLRKACGYDLDTAVFAGETDFKPAFEGHEYLLERQLKPEACKDIVEELDKAGIVPTAMMDVSDGLSSELLHICSQSHVGCRIYEDRIPIDYQTAIMATEFNMNLVTAALNGGEDYELLFTVPLEKLDTVAAIPGIRVIGHITKPDLGCCMITRDDVEITLRAQGWNSLAEEEE